MLILFTARVSRDGRDVYIAVSQEFPEYFGAGKTEERAVEDLRRALLTAFRKEERN